MFSSSRRFKRNIFLRNTNTSILSGNSNSLSLAELQNRVAVRFFVRKSKRFDYLNQQMQQKAQKVNELKTESSPECLIYLGLAPKDTKMHKRESGKQEKKKCPDFQFPEPRIYECSHCKKIFFHKLPYRRHMIHHIRTTHWCTKCSKQFASKTAQRRHELMCRY